MTLQGVFRGGLRVLEPDAVDAKERAERYVRNIVDRFEREHDLGFTLIAYVRYY